MMYYLLGLLAAKYNLKVYFLNIGNIFIRTIKNPIRENAKNALLIRFISIPSFNKRPITLNGMPNLIRGLAIYLEIFGFFFSKKKTKN